MNQETEKMIDRVEQHTGYKVSVGTGEGFSAYAQMITATPENPVHVININQKYSDIGDYVVAIQCAMILTKWSNPDKIPVFVENNDKISYRIEKCANNAKLAKFKPDAARKFAGLIVKGLLHQLLSIPSEMIAIDICRTDCPGLLNMMHIAVNNEIQEFHQSLEPKIRQVTPEDIFKKNASMNAAFAVYWSRISENQHVLIPFMALDVLDKGKELLKVFDNISETDVQKYTKVVDGWALELELSTLYKWEYMEK